MGNATRLLADRIAHERWFWGIVRSAVDVLLIMLLFSRQSLTPLCSLGSRSGLHLVQSTSSRTASRPFPLVAKNVLNRRTSKCTERWFGMSRRLVHAWLREQLPRAAPARRAASLWLE